MIEQAVRLGFKASNNEVEYEALIVGMQKAKHLGVEDLVIHCDSQLVANQLTGKYAARNERMGACENPHFSDASPHGRRFLLFSFLEK